MWEQDDWNSCEDLTVCQNYPTAWNYALDGETTQRHPYNYLSSYPVGCGPELKVTKDRQVVAPDKRKSEVRENPRASLMTCMTRRKPSWMKAVGRFVKTIRSAREEEGIDSFKKKANRASDNKHHHTSKSGRAVIGKPPCPSHDQPVQLWSFTQVIPKRFTRTAPASSPMTSNPAQNQNSRSSESISMISTKSSTSLPINKPAVSDNESFIAPLDASSLPFTLLPLLDTATFEPFSFEPNDLIEELR